MKDIPDFGGLYAITKMGNIWSHPKTWERKNGIPSSHKGKWMRPYLMNGYKAIVLRGRDGKKKRLLVHRLVALTYLKVPKLEVNHKNGNRSDCTLGNLEWVTRRENAYHGISRKEYPTIFRSGESSTNSKLTDKKVREIRNMAAEGTRTYKQIASIYGVDNSVISRIVNRQTWFHLE